MFRKDVGEKENKTTPRTINQKTFMNN